MITAKQISNLLFEHGALILDVKYGHTTDVVGKYRLLTPVSCYFFTYDTSEQRRQRLALGFGLESCFVVGRAFTPSELILRMLRYDQYNGDKITRISTDTEVLWEAK